jgi:hypothetical protein
MNVAALTICSFNYIPKALVLLDSYNEFHPDHSLTILIVDKKREGFAPDNHLINIIWVEDLAIDDLYKYAFSFDIIEFNTNVKPTIMKYLLRNHDAVIYLDPDIQIFSRLDIVITALSKASIIVVPHSNKPILDGCKPDDSDLLRFGAYNLGFVAISNCEETISFLDWWSDRCLKLGYYEPQLGLAVDQKWMDLGPSFFPNLIILHDNGLNVAFWNLHDRYLSKVNGQWIVNEKTPLIFFHFSSFNSSSTDVIAYKQTRFAPGSRADFTAIAEEYSTRLNKFRPEIYENEKYGFDYFEDGVYINPVLRRFYSILKNDMFPVENPFKTDSKLREFALKNRLLNLNKTNHKRLTFKDLDRFGKQERIFFWILKGCLFLFGPEKYFAFMRYLAHISSIRNQQKMFLREEKQKF